MDPLAELAYDFTPYRYGFNNPVYWGDASGLFETEMQAKAFALSKGFNSFNSKVVQNKKLGGYSLIITAGLWKGAEFYDFHMLQLPDIIGNSSSGGGSSSGSGGDIHQQNVQKALDMFKREQEIQYWRDIGIWDDNKTYDNSFCNSDKSALKKTKSIKISFLFLISRYLGLI